MSADPSLAPGAGSGRRRLGAFGRGVWIGRSAALLMGLVIGLSVGDLIAQCRPRGPVVEVTGGRRLGLELAAQGACQRAVIYLRPVVALDPSDYRAIEALGSCLGSLSEYGLAIPLLDKAARHTASVDAYMRLASFAYQAGQSVIEKQALRRAASLSASPEEMMGVANQAESFGEYGLSLYELHAISPAQRSYEWWGLASKDRLGEGDFSSAIADARAETLRAPPGSAGAAWEDLGVALAAAGMCPAGVSAFTHALIARSGTNIASSYASIVQCELALNRLRTAAWWIQRGLTKIHGGVPRYQLLLAEGMVMADLGHLVGADRILQELVQSHNAPADLSASARSLLTAIATKS